MAPTPAPPGSTSTDYFALPLARRVGWVVLLGAMTALGAFTIDLYLPAFPTLGAELGASDSTVQLTLTGMLVGLAVGQLAVGPLSDAWGRRRPLLAGLALHLVASLLCVVAPSIEVLLGLRALQGVGTAAASVVAMAVIRDLFHGAGAARLLSRLMLVIGVAPVFAPTIGSWLLAVTSWRGIFAVLGLLSLTLMVVAHRVLPETLPADRRTGTGVAAVLRSYRSVLSDRATPPLLLVAGTSMSALFGYVSGASFVLQRDFGLSQQQFGLVFAAGGLLMVVGTQTTGQLAGRIAPEKLLTAGLVSGVAGALTMLVAVETGSFGLFGLLVPLWWTLVSFGVAMPNAPILALSRHGRTAGTAAALLGCVQFGIGAATAPLVGLVGMSASSSMAIVMAGGLALALALTVFGVLPALRRDARETRDAAAELERIAAADRTSRDDSSRTGDPRTRVSAAQLGEPVQDR